MGTVCLLWSAWLHWRGKEVPWGLFSTGALLALLGFLKPSTLRIPNLLWERLGRLLGRINGTIILGALYFCIMTPLAIFFRWIGRDALALKKGAPAGGWSDCPDSIRDVSHYERMY